MNPEASLALVRGVPGTYGDCIRPPGSGDPIDVDLARRQHRAYCEALLGLGLKLIEIEADDRFPDCCFVEDTAILAGGRAIIARMGAGSRVGEEVVAREHLREHMEIHEFEAPARIDGGDVLIIDRRVYVGMGGRTNRQAIEQLRDILGPAGYEVLGVTMTGVLHLKSACTYLGNGHILLLPGRLDHRVFDGYKAVLVPEEEAYAANCLSVNGTVMISSGCPMVRGLIQARGFETIGLEMSEFRKGQGSLTCLSKIF